MENLKERIYQYVLSQSEPVTIGNIASDAQFKDSTRREIGAALIELQKESALYRTVKNGKAYYSEGEGQGMNPSQKNIDDFQNILNFLESLNALQDEIPTELEIGDTGFDLYKWTFTQGKRQKGNDWSIAIPDGFVVIDSEERLFEAVPEGMTTENGIPLISILPGVEQVSSEMRWPHHIHARNGLAAHQATKIAKITAEVLDNEMEIASCVFDDIMAGAQIFDTGDASYSYQWSVMTGDKTQMIRIQTQAITDKQKKILDQSVMDLIRTFKFDKPNSLYPTEPAISTAKVLNDLIKGDTESFEEAVDMAKYEYAICIVGRIGSLQFMAEHDLLDDEAPDTVRKILTEGREVQEFYHVEADKLVEKLKSANVNASIMKKVYNKLKDLEEARTEIEVEHKKVSVAVTKKTDKIQKKWKNEAEHLPRTADTRSTRNNINAEREKSNEELADTVYDIMRYGCTYRTSEFINVVDGIRNTSKAASILNILVNEGRVERFTENGAVKYKKLDAPIKRERPKTYERTIEDWRAEKEEEKQVREKAVKEAKERRLAREKAAKESLVRKKGETEEDWRAEKEAEKQIRENAVKKAEERRLAREKAENERRMREEKAAKESIARQKAETERQRAEEEQRKLQAEKALAEKRERERIEKEKRDEKLRKNLIKAGVIILVILILIIAAKIVFGSIIPAHKYQNATELLNAGQFDEAYRIFRELRDYEDSSEMAQKAIIQKGEQFMSEGKWDEAIASFEEITKYEYNTFIYDREYIDLAEEKITETIYLHALNCEENSKDAEAIKLFNSIGDYKNSKERLNKLMYAYVKANKKRSNETTYNYLCKLKADDYKDSEKIYEKLYAWKVKVIVNTSEYDETTNLTSISVRKPLYFHISLSGGTPEGSTRVSYRYVLPSGKEGGSKFDSSWSAGSSGSAYWESGLYGGDYGQTGNLKMRFYDSNGNQIGSVTVRLV